MLAVRKNVQEFIRSFIKLVITFTVLYVIRTILLSLPGIAVPILNFPITFAIIGNVVLGILMIAIVLRFEREIAQPLRNISLPSPVTSVITNLAYLTAIWIAYITFYPLIDGVLPNLVWVYSLLLFIIAIFPLGRISITFYRSIDKLTEIISKGLVKPRLRTKEKWERCPSCGNTLEPNAEFCTYCGARAKDPVKLEGTKEIFR